MASVFADPAFANTALPVDEQKAAIGRQANEEHLARIDELKAIARQKMSQAIVQDKALMERKQRTMPAWQSTSDIKSVYAFGGRNPIEMKAQGLAFASPQQRHEGLILSRIQDRALASQILEAEKEAESRGEVGALGAKWNKNQRAIWQSGKMLPQAEIHYENDKDAGWLAIPSDIKERVKAGEIMLGEHLPNKLLQKWPRLRQMYWERGGSVGEVMPEEAYETLDWYTSDNEKQFMDEWKASQS